MCHNLLNYSLKVVHQLLSCISTQLLVLSQHQPSKSLNHGESIQPPAEFSRKSQAGNLCHYKFTSLYSLRSATLLVIYLHADLTQFSNPHSSSNPSFPYKCWIKVSLLPWGYNLHSPPNSAFLLHQITPHVTQIYLYLTISAKTQYTWNSSILKKKFFFFLDLHPSLYSLLFHSKFPKSGLYL